MSKLTYSQDNVQRAERGSRPGRSQGHRMRAAQRSPWLGDDVAADAQPGGIVRLHPQEDGRNAFAVGNAVETAEDRQTFEDDELRRSAVHLPERLVSQARRGKHGDVRT